MPGWRSSQASAIGAQAGAGFRGDLRPSRRAPRRPLVAASCFDARAAVATWRSPPRCGTCRSGTPTARPKNGSMAMPRATHSCLQLALVLVAADQIVLVLQHRERRCAGCVRGGQRRREPLGVEIRGAERARPCRCFTAPSNAATISLDASVADSPGARSRDRRSRCAAARARRRATASTARRLVELGAAEHPGLGVDPHLVAHAARFRATRRSRVSLSPPLWPGTQAE